VPEVELEIEDFIVAQTVAALTNASSEAVLRAVGPHVGDGVDERLVGCGVSGITGRLVGTHALQESVELGIVGERNDSVALLAVEHRQPRRAKGARGDVSVQFEDEDKLGVNAKDRMALGVDGGKGLGAVVERLSVLASARVDASRRGAAPRPPLPLQLRSYEPEMG
jgi:hypothetical protein